MAKYSQTENKNENIDITSELQEKNENTDVVNELQEKDEKIEELLKKQRRDRVIKIILIIIIIILLLFLLLGSKIGKIGYQDNINTSTKVNENVFIRITKDDIDIDKNESLGIFKNQKFNGEEKIAPNSTGTYQFCLKNESNNDIIYHIKFLEETSNFVNMKYKLKIDNIYIRGNENEYVGIEQLDVENVKVLKDSNNIYTIEWFWEDNDEADTFVGSKKDLQYYTLKLKINASVYNEREEKN